MKRIRSLFYLTLLVLALPASAQEPHTGVQSNQTKVDTLDNPDLLWLKKGFEGNVGGLVMGFFPDGQSFLSFGGDPALYLIRRTSDGELLKSFPMAVPGSAIPVLFADATLIAEGGSGLLVVLDAHSGEIVHSITTSTATLGAVVLTSDHREVLTVEYGSHEGGKVQLWDVQSGAKVREYGPLPGDSYAYASAISPDGRYVVVGTTRGVVYVWELQSGTQVKVLTATNDLVRMHFSHDGKYLATNGTLGSGNDSKYVTQLWSTTDWHLVHTLWGHSSPVHDCAFTPGDRFLVSGGDDGLRGWNIQTEEQLYYYSYISPSAHVPVAQYPVIIAPDSTSLISSVGGFMLHWQAHWSPASSVPYGDNPAAIAMSITPNPANGSALLEFMVSDGLPTSVHGNITDLQGREMISLPAQMLSPGQQQIPFNISALSSGQYFCTVRMNNRVATTRLLVQH